MLKAEKGLALFALALALHMVFNVIGVFNCIQMGMYMLFLGLTGFYMFEKYQPKI
jgi:hypothetical protein